MSSDLFLRPSFSEHDFYASLRDTQHPNAEAARQEICALWQVYQPIAPLDFRKNLQREFPQRWWEMYLAVGLIKLGFNIKHDPNNHGPDLSLEYEDCIFFLEATAPNAGTGPNILPNRPECGVHEVPEDKFLLRLTQGLTDKLKKFALYKKQSVIPEESYCLICISATDLNRYGTLLEGKHPMLSVLAGAGHTVVTFGAKIPPYTSYRPLLTTVAGGLVNACLFKSHEFRIISGVLYSPVDHRNPRLNAGNTFTLFINPEAEHPLSKQFCAHFTSWRATEITEQKTIWERSDPI